MRRGPRIDVTLNGETVSSIDLSAWTEAGKRPDGSSHKFKNVRIGGFNRPGFLGFQDHGSDCWFKNVKIKSSD
ncbi:MAG: family 16 glycoside hydrolase [Isosphaeraceae bacterium]